jgi:hypothetical protein
VDDVYTLLEFTEPDKFAICWAELHDADVQRLMVTVSPDLVPNEVKKRLISPASELMSHLQSS